jgi:hypothetical protein
MIDSSGLWFLPLALACLLVGRMRQPLERLALLKTSAEINKCRTLSLGAAFEVGHDAPTQLRCDKRRRVVHGGPPLRLSKKQIPLPNSPR